MLVYIIKTIISAVLVFGCFKYGYYEGLKHRDDKDGDD